MTDLFTDGPLLFQVGHLALQMPLTPREVFESQSNRGQPHGLQNLQLKQYGFAGHAHPAPVLQVLRRT